jgi:hypothetical protein
MKFQQFTKQLKETLCGTQIQEESVCHGHSIILATDGKVFVDNKETELTSIEEAKQYINQILLEEELSQELYEEIPQIKIAELINEYHDTKVTDTLIEEYIELASSKQFIADPVIQEIRKINSVDNLIEGKIDYKLNDGSIVAIDESTNIRINNILAQHSDVADYMRESKENFLNVIREL